LAHLIDWSPLVSCETERWRSFKLEENVDGRTECTTGAENCPRYSDTLIVTYLFFILAMIWLEVGGRMKSPRGNSGRKIGRKRSSK
jgi:hypothetical protein